MHLGQGHRQANFIRLYRITDQDVARYNLTQDDCVLLHKSFRTSTTLALRALPEHMHHAYSRDPMPSDCAWFSLNVISFLNQGYSITSKIRLEARERLRYSKDPESQRWPRFRRDTIVQSLKSHKRLSFIMIFYGN